MPKQYEIRADYNADTIVMYQAYAPAIATPALKAQKFVQPFSFNRMTWIKPSFLWLMHRSNWGHKSGQECILAVRITRHGWEEALSLGVLTSFHPKVHRTVDQWREQFENGQVHVQWDPERSLRGADLQYDSIQVGLSRHIIRRFVDEWIVAIDDYTPLAQKMHALLRAGKEKNAANLVPRERVYPVAESIAQRLRIDI
jgi:hypothetical protein